MPPEVLEGFVADAADNGARKLVYLRAAGHRWFELHAVQGEHEVRGPPGDAGSEQDDD